MTLTVKEKEHWKISINRKVQRAIDAIYDEGEANLRDRIQKESRAQSAAVARDRRYASP
jgi:hypothetical protein